MNNIHIALATSEPIIADRLLKSMKETLTSFNITASVLIFGMHQATFNTHPFCVQVDIIDIIDDYPPIYKNRNRCQHHLQEKMKHNHCIGFILDDDLVWTMPEQDFIKLLDQLSTNSCDIAFSSLTGDTPIPKEYTRTSPLLDVLFAIANDVERVDVDYAIIKFVKNVRRAKGIMLNHYSHHDYYSYDRNDFHPVEININTHNWPEFIQNIAKGKVTTRPVLLPHSVESATGRERGGATLILTPSVLDFTNRAMSSGSYVSRRSDMLMATDVRNAGYKMFNTPPMLEHLREDTFDTHDVRKLIGDILGFALVETVTSKTYTTITFKNKLIERINKTAFLLSQTTAMLKLLIHWLRARKHITESEIEILQSIIIENDTSAHKLAMLDVAQLSLDFTLFTQAKNIQDTEAPQRHRKSATS